MDLLRVIDENQYSLALLTNIRLFALNAEPPAADFKTLNSYQMPTPQIIWCAQSSLHYIIESSVRYAMPLFLALQLKDHLKSCMKRNGSNCVEEWVSGLSPADRMLVKIMSHNTDLSERN